MAGNFVGVLVLWVVVAMWSSTEAALRCTDASCLCTPTHLDRGILWTCKVPQLQRNMINLDRLPANDSKFLALKCDKTVQTFSELWNHMFKDLPKLLSLSIENCHISEIPELAFAGLSRMDELTIKYASISLIHENSFRMIPRLRLLEVISSEISHMPNLCSIKSLRTLNVSGNSINDFERTGLKCDGSDGPLTNFEILDVSFNKIGKIPAWFGKAFPKLKRLTSSDNKLTQIDEDALNKLQELMWLDLSNNSLRTFPAGFISKCSDLRVLALGLNPVTNLSLPIISRNTQLTHLILSNMSLTDDFWPELLGLKRLQLLHLSSNKFTIINSTVMERMPLLEDLDLSRNSILNFNIFTFQDQYKLRSLNLSHNEIEAVPKQAFKFVHSLKTLDLSKNHISLFAKSAFKGLKKLKVVDMSRNSLVDLPLDVFVGIKSLQMLSLSRNKLSDIPRFYDSQALEKLDLSFNNITNIEITTFIGLTGLLELDMSNNNLDYIPHGIFQHCKILKSLDLSLNDIAKIADGGFHSLTNLVKLNLEENKLSEAVRFLTNLQALSELNLRGNYLTNIYRGQFPDSIESLDLSMNNIDYIAPFTFRSMSRLKTVLLQFNNITSLPVLAVEIARNLVPKPVFYISANPLKCDCTASWLKEIADGETANVDLYPNIVDFKLVMCTSVYNSNPKFFYRVPRSDFLCSYSDKCEYGCPCCAQTSCKCRYLCPPGCQCLISDDKTNIHKIHCENINMTSVPANIPAAATELMLDGNNFTTLDSGVFEGLASVKRIYLNGSKIQQVSNETFKGLTNVLKVYLNDNNISVLPSPLFPDSNLLSALYLHGNQLTTIEDESLSNLESLQYVSLNQNLLHEINISDLRSLLNSTNVSMSGNPWSCSNCKFMSLLRSYSNVITDVDDVRCVWTNVTADSVSVLDDAIKKYCFFNKTDVITGTILDIVPKSDIHIAAMITISVAMVVIASVLILAYVKRDLIQVWCFVKYGWRVHNNADDDEDDVKRPFDAFLSYSNRDERFVINELAPRLEHGEKKYKLCLHYRDFPVGACIAETIVRSVECSKRTIMLISNNFLLSEWCRYEFQTAHHQVLAEKKNRLILVLLEDVDKNKLDSQLKLYFKTRTYLKYSDPWFWDKLHYVMPNPCLPLLEHNGTIKRERLPMNPRFERNISHLSEQILNDDMYEVPLANHYQTIESPGHSEYNYGSASGHYEEVNPCPNAFNNNIPLILAPPPIPKHPPPSRTSSVYKV